jgi:hypothetical protein
MVKIDSVHGRGRYTFSYFTLIHSRSIKALSVALPLQSIRGRMPWLSTYSENTSDLKGLPWSVLMISSLPCCLMASSKVCWRHSASMLLDIDQLVIISQVVVNRVYFFCGLMLENTTLIQSLFFHHYLLSDQD